MHSGACVEDRTSFGCWGSNLGGEAWQQALPLSSQSPHSLPPSSLCSLGSLLIDVSLQVKHGCLLHTHIHCPVPCRRKPTLLIIEKYYPQLDSMKFSNT